jgi:ACS family glucarate transporter-like MFS transporter
MREASIHKEEVPDADSPVRADSRVRWRILALLFLISMVTYLDRVNVSIAAQQMMAAYSLSGVQMGKIFSAFILAYALFQVPGGWLADKFGPRIVLAGAVTWWSAFTALTAAAVHFFSFSSLPAVSSLVLVRFGLGMGEAAAWPNFNRTIASWMAPRDRAFASSVPLAGGGLGATLTPPFIAWLMVKYGWQLSFYVSAAIGLSVAALWLRYSRDRPEDHPAVNAEELDLIQGVEQSTPRTASQGTIQVPWRAILLEPNVWLLAVINATCGYVAYIYLTWFFTYLIEARHLTLVRGSIYTTGPFLAITCLTPLGGKLGDRATRLYGKPFGRKLIGMGGMLIAGSALFLGARESNINIAILGLSLGAGAVFFSFSAQWAVTIDITREYAGTVSGIMNFVGNLGGMVSPVLMPLLAYKLGWTPALEIASGVIIAGSMLWIPLRPERPIYIADVQAPSVAIDG